MKIIMDRLNSEKQQYLKENNQMARELMEIKELLMGAVGQSQEWLRSIGDSIGAG